MAQWLGATALRTEGERSGCALAVIATGAAALLRWLLDPLLDDSAQYLLFYFSVMFAATAGGLRSGLLATALGAAAGTWLFVHLGHVGPTWTDDLTRLALYLLFAAVASFLAGRLWAARNDAAARAAQLSESRQRLAGIIDSAMDAIITIDEQQRIVLFNPTAEKAFGCPAAEALGSPIDRFIPPRFQEAHRVHVREFGRTGDTARAMSHLRPLSAVRADGEEFPVEASISRVALDNRQLFTVILRDISERVRAEEALRASQAMVRLQAAALEAAPSAISLSETDHEGTIVWVNPAFTRMTGYSAEEAIGRSHHILSSGRQDEAFYRMLWESISRGEVWRGELVNRRKDGALYHEEMGVTPLRDEEGRITHYVAVKQDITARKEAEEKLRESEAKYRTLFENIGEEVHFWQLVRDEAGQIRTWRLEDANPAALKTWTRRLDEIKGKTADEIFGPGATEHFMPVVRKIMSEGVPHSFEDHFAPLGRTFRFTTVPLGAHFITTGADITERKRADEALRASEQRFRTVAENAQAVVGIVQGPRFVYVNPFLTQISGYSSEEVLAMDFIRLVRPDYQPMVADYARRRQLGEAVPTHYEFAMLTKSGQTRWIDLSVGPIVYDGRPGIVGTGYDVTQRKQAEEELHAAKFSAEQANAAKDHFLAVLSHELRNPLAPVLPALAALEKLVPEGGREFLEIARRNVELEARLIDDLLDVTRIARGKIELDRKVVELRMVLRRAAEVCQPDIEARRLHFGIQAEGGPCPVRVDPARLQQVFWNLIKNAVKFTPPGGCVGVRCWRENGQVMAQVSDSGQGIEPEALGRIFDAFEQESRSTTRQFGGLGLGLAISKALVELHGGTIQVSSEGKGKGAAFTVALPVAEPRPMEKPAAPAAEAGPPVPARTLSILLVEDHGDTARIMGRLLAAEGHSVAHAGDVATALELAGAQTFDVLISDVGLPDGSGHDLMRALRARGQRLPGIALSGYGMAEDVQRSREAGFAEHLTKPVDFEALLAAAGRAAHA